MGMIKGMTGFGSAQISIDDAKIVVEVKSLNHRYFDISYFLPIGFANLEQKIRQIIEKEVERGRITVSVKILQKSKYKISLNNNTVSQYIKYMNILKKKFGLEDSLSLSDLVKLPGVFETKESSIDSEVLRKALESGLKKSMDSLTHMRNREGRSLAVDLNGILKRMHMQINKIQSRTVFILKGKREILNKEEFTAFQKCNDISEEITRLGHYIDELKLLLKSTIPVGKKIDFMAQEMQRGTNTIGSKCQDQIVSQAVIALKNKIEKIREQSQNIE